MPRVTHLARNAARIWPLALARSQQGWRWLTTPRDPITWAALRAKLTTLPLPSTNAGRFAVLGGVILLLLLVLPWYAKGHKDEKGVVTYPNAALINPILAGIGATLLIYAALRQAHTASDRHEVQTKADLQRRITESFSKAIEQLASEKIEVRLGGIYTLERISKESPDDYWTVVETLTAFVRECARWKETDSAVMDSMAWFYRSADEQDEPPQSELPTDITAVLTVIKRRTEVSREREKMNEWYFDLRNVDLRGANFGNAYFVRGGAITSHWSGGMVLLLAE